MLNFVSHLILFSLPLFPKQKARSTKRKTNGTVFKERIGKEKVFFTIHKGGGRTKIHPCRHYMENVPRPRIGHSSLDEF